MLVSTNPCNGNNRFFLAAAFCETLVLDCKIGFLLAFYSGKGTLDEQGFEILSRLGTPGGFFLAGALVIRRGKSSSGTQMPVRFKDRHISANL